MPKMLWKSALLGTLFVLSSLNLKADSLKERLSKLLRSATYSPNEQREIAADIVSKFTENEVRPFFASEIARGLRDEEANTVAWTLLFYRIRNSTSLLDVAMNSLQGHDPRFSNLHPTQRVSVLEALRILGLPSSSWEREVLIRDFLKLGYNDKMLFISSMASLGSYIESNFDYWPKISAALTRLGRENPVLKSDDQKSEISFLDFLAETTFQMPSMGVIEKTLDEPYLTLTYEKEGPEGFLKIVLSPRSEYEKTYGLISHLGSRLLQDLRFDVLTQYIFSRVNVTQMEAVLRCLMWSAPKNLDQTLDALKNLGPFVPLAFSSLGLDTFDMNHDVQHIVGVAMTKPAEWFTPPSQAPSRHPLVRSISRSWCELRAKIWRR